MNTPVDNPKRVVFKHDDDSDRMAVGTMTQARAALRERETCDECGDWDYDSLALFTTDEGDHLLAQVLCMTCHPDIPVV